jgi:hypothetical protein
MSKIILGEHQTEAIKKMHNGCILCGGVGTGKSRTAIGYFYFIECDGRKKVNGIGTERPMKNPRDLYIITTARKRDLCEWLDETILYDICTDASLNECGIKLTIDSWNNIKKYKDVKNSFFIFDEQRVIGYGTWVKTFLTITKSNHWILLSATPGDCWSDYIPVFIANGFYKNKTDFVRQHVIYNYRCKFPKVDRYVNQGKLLKHKEDILIPMKYEKQTIQHHLDTFTNYDKEQYKMISIKRWDIFENKPIDNPSKLCYLLRRVVNSDKTRLEAVKDIYEEYGKAIIFYNFNYELKDLEELCQNEGIIFSEWNGIKHEEIPNNDKWLYLVQYTAGCEGWNCTTCNCMIFFSQNYSYRVMEQASGRIDRLNTPYTDLFYYHLRSRSAIDNAIYSSLKKKRKFNEAKFTEKIFGPTIVATA